MAKHGKASVKVPGGKLVRVDVDFSDRLEEINITGDFFLEPPEALEEFEEALIGLDTNFSESDIIERLEKIDAQTIGFEKRHIAEALTKVIE